MIRGDICRSTYSLRRWCFSTNLFVLVALLQGSEVLEHIEDDLEGRPGDFHMRCPTTKLLVCGNTIGQYLFVNVHDHPGPGGTSGFTLAALRDEETGIDCSKNV